MPAPTFNLPVYGTAPDQYATEASFEASINAALQDLWLDVTQNGGKSFMSRAAAVAAGQDQIPYRLGLIITLEMPALVVRGWGYLGDDPLFSTSPYWGVVTRIDTASAMRDAGVMSLEGVAGTADQITAQLPAAARRNGVTATSGTSIVEVIPIATNTGAVEPTLAIDDGAAAVIKSESGAALAAGQLVAGRSYLLRRRGSVWRIISGGVALADLIQQGALRSAAIRDAGILPLANIAGTGDAITADLHASLIAAGIASLSSSAAVEFTPIATNTAANPVITIAGTAFGIRNADGAAWPAGAFIVGRSYQLRRRGTILRVTGGDSTYVDLAAARADRITSVSQMGAPVLVSVAGTGNAVTASVPATVQATGVLAASVRAVSLIWPADNAAGAVTLAIDGQPAIEVRDIAGAVPAAGALRGGSLTHLVMDATQNWRIASPETRRAEVVAIQSQVAAMRAKEAFAGDPAVLAEDGSGSAVGYFNDAGDLLVPAIIAGRQLAGDDGMRVVSDASGQPLIWADPQQGRLGLAPVDWSSQSLEGFGWDRAFARLHAGDPVVLFEDAGGSAVMWVDEDGRLIGGGGGGGGITRPLPSTSGNAWQVVDDGTSVRYLSDQYQGRVMGFEERGGVILTDSSPIAIGVLAYGGGSASVSRQLIEDWRYNVRQPDLSHSGGMLAAEAAAAASLSLRHARRLATPSMITLTASIGSPVAADTNAASPLFGAAMAEIAQAVISLEDWGKDLVVDRVCLSILGGAPDTLPLTAENEYASVASALRAQIVTATGQAQPPLIVVSPSAGAREGGAMAVSHVEARLDQTHPALGFVVAGPRHAYDLEPDTVGTLSRQGATLMTEMEAIAVREVQGGGLWYCPILISASRSGAVITAQFAALTDLVLDPGGDHGFALVGVTNDAVISSVSIAGRTATITLSEPPTGSLTLHCASGRSGTPTGARPVNRTDIRDQWGEASLQVAGYTHRRRALPAAVTVS